MFLFPWLDWGIDISDFGKIEFLTHKPFLAFSALWKRAFLDPQVKFRADYGGVEYSDVPEFFFWKLIISAFKRRIWNFYITPRYDNPAISLKKSEKKHPDWLFAMPVSKCLICGILLFCHSFYDCILRVIRCCWTRF